MNYWWNEYVGIPYKAQGRDRDGVDCWGLVRLVYADQFQTELPTLVENYASDNQPSISALVHQTRADCWEPVTTPMAGDVVLFKMLGQLSHVGIAAAPGTFLHAREGYAATIERLDSGAWKNRFEGFYRLQSIPKLNQISLAAVSHPLRSGRVDGMVPANMSLAEIADFVKVGSGIVGPLNYDAILTIDGEVIPQELWAVTKPPHGARVEYRAVPRGSFGRALLMIVVIVAAVIVAPYLAPLLPTALGAAGSLAAATGILTFAGSMLVNAIFPVRLPQNNQNDPGTADRQNLLQGGVNSANQYGSIPIVLGKFRFTPPVGAINYVESNATTSYLKMLLVWGYGPLQVSDIRVGENKIDSYEEVEYQTIEGASLTEDKQKFNSLYGQDVDQIPVNQVLQAPQRYVSAASRTSNVITVTTTTAHEYAVGMIVRLFGNNATTLAEGVLLAITSSTTFTVSSVGTNGSIAASRVTGGAWIERVVDEEVDRITATIHFPEGLRRIKMKGDNAGDVAAIGFTGFVQVRQLNSTTLAPITDWGDIDKVVAQKTFSLPTAFYNTDTDAEIESVYQWHRVTLDSYNNLIVRAGAYTAAPTAEPSGLLLQRLQNETKGLNTTFTRLPDIPAGEIELYRIGIFGNAVYQTIDVRTGITGCAITNTARQFTVASGVVSRAQTETISIGLSGQPYFKRKDAFTINVTFQVPLGKYEVRARRQNGNIDEESDFKNYYSSYLVSITGYSNRRPVTPPKPLAMTALRVKATDQINGNIEGISGTVISVCPDWDNATDTWITRPTRNPASLLRYVLQHPANAQAVADSGIDLATLATWHEYCSANSFMFDAIVAEQRSILDVLRDVAAAGRASPTLRDGKWTVTIDQPRTVVAQYFTPHNSWGFESTRMLPKTPHALRVSFNNSEAGFEPDEMIVYNDGYTSANATAFEALVLPGVTTKNQIYKHARFHLAQIKLRPETYVLSADIEHLICTRGDLVRVTHDVPMWGLGTGRIKSLTSGTVLELSESVPMVANTQYTIRIRLADGSSVTRTVASKTTDGEYTSITLTASVTTTQAADGNLYMFGSLSAESVELVVLAIEPAENLTARLTLTDYSPAIYSSDSEPIPAFNSKITLAPKLLQNIITASPTISNIVSDESVMVRLSPGQYGYNIKISFTNPSTLPQTVSIVEGQIDFAEDTSLDWQRAVRVPSSNSAIMFSDVQEGDQYRMRLRYITEDGRTGPWVYTSNHTVVGKTNPPGAVTGTTAALVGQSVLLDWDDNPEVDVVAYEVRTTDSGWGDSTRLFRGDVSAFNVTPAAAGTARTWYVKAIDAAGLYSETATAVSFTVQVPPNPASITETFADTSLTNATITLDWPDVSPQAGLSNYIVSYDSVVKTIKASTITLPADWLGNRTYTIKTVDLLGNQSTGVTKTIAKLAPNPVTNLRAQVIDNNVLLYWDFPAKTTLPIQHVIIKKGDVYATAETIGTKDGGFTSLQELRAGTYTYWVVTVDTDDNLSTPVGVSSEVAEPPDFIFHGEFDSTLTGTKISAITDQGVILLPVNTTETWEGHFTRNVLTYSEQFDNAAWAKTNGTVSANAGIAPNGTLSADSFTGTSATSNTKYLNASFSAISGLHVGSIYAKAGTHSVIQLMFFGGVTPSFGGYANFDLANGVVGSFDAIGTPEIKHVGNGWYRCSYSSTLTTAPSFVVMLANSTTAGRFGASTTTGNSLFWGAQLEPGRTKPGFYIPTTTTALDASPQNQINAGFPVFIQPANGSGYYEETFDFGSVLASSRVSTTYTGTIVAGAPVISVTTSISPDNVTFTAYPGTDIFGTNFRYVKIRITATDAVGTGLYQLATLNTRLDAKLRNDAGTVSALSTDASGTIANFVREFVDITSINVSAEGTTAVTPVYNFKDQLFTGTYSVTSNVCTVNATAHDQIVGQKVKLAFSGGTAPDGVYIITSVPTANSFTVAITTANTSGNCSTYSQGCRIYLFNSAGARVSGTASWSVKGY